MTIDKLVKAARSAPPANRRVRCTDRWMPVVKELRAKNYTYADIWQWLKDRGQDVHANPRVFASAASRRFRNWINNQ
jgi:hypothetical protein